MKFSEIKGMHDTLIKREDPHPGEVRSFAYIPMPPLDDFFNAKPDLAGDILAPDHHRVDWQFDGHEWNLTTKLEYLPEASVSVVFELNTKPLPSPKDRSYIDEYIELHVHINGFGSFAVRYKSTAYHSYYDAEQYADRRADYYLSQAAGRIAAIIGERIVELGVKTRHRFFNTGSNQILTELLKQTLKNEGLDTPA